MKRDCLLSASDIIKIENVFFKNIGCSFKFLLKVGVEESIVNAPRIMDQG
jgi:hypothetical protein